MNRQSYPSDLTDAQWELIKPLIPPPKPGGRPRKVDMREIINGALSEKCSIYGIFYLNRSGCSWRMLPHDHPPWGTVHYYYRKWRLDGIWQKIHDTLREQVRKEEGREATPSAAIIDSQSVKTTEKGGLEVMTQVKRSTVENATSW